jgi:hypothetical protein
MGRIVIEVCGPRNEQLAFPMMAGQDGNGGLRGRWSAAAVAYADKSEGMKAMSAVSIIPGIHIWLDVKERKAGIYDPLRDTDDGRRVWADVKRILDRYSFAFGGPFEPWQPVTRENLTIDDIKDWAFHMRTALDGNLAQYVPGSDQLPTIDKIRSMPGRRHADMWNTGRMGQEIPLWVDVVEAPADKRVAAAVA